MAQSLAQIQAYLTKLYAERDRITTGGQAYTADQRAMQRVALKDVETQIARYEAMERRLQSGSGGLAYAVPASG